MRILGFLLLTVLLGGCSLGSSDGKEFEQSQLERVVLQPADLPDRYIQFDEGRQGLADLPGGSRSDAARFGRVDGWKARYRVPGGERSAGPQVIESRADLFESQGGAEDELDAIEQPGFTSVDAPEIGDEARAWQSGQGGPGTVRYYAIAWRVGNLTASLLVSGFAGQFELEDALGLARKQQARIQGIDSAVRKD